MLRIGILLVVLSFLSIYSLPQVNAQPIYNSTTSIDLLSDMNWTPFHNAVVNTNGSGLVITSDTTDKAGIYEIESPIYDRAFGDLNMNNDSRPKQLHIEYSTSSELGDGLFVMELRSDNGSTILWNISLGNTDNTVLKKVTDFPNFSGELRFYIITSEPSFNMIYVKNAKIYPYLSPFATIFPWLYPEF